MIDEELERKPQENGPQTNGSFFEYTQRFSTDAACREFLESRRWPNGPICPRCGGTKAYKLQGKSTRPGVYKCAGCRKPFTVTVGTIYEDTHIPLPKWFAATYLMMTSKKGISANQASRMLGISKESAWFMMHRIRHAFRKRERARKALRGTIEADETYIGGRAPGKRGRGAGSKVPVFAMVQRGGKVRAQPIPNAKAATLHTLIQENVYSRSRLFTDDFTSYMGLKKKKFDHRKVNHSKKEYVRVEEDGIKVHTNTVESFFALLKRGIHGTFHHVSPKKLPLYCDEFCFRYDYRAIKDAPRFEQAFHDVGGRLTWYFKNGGIMKGCKPLRLPSQGNL